MVVLLRYWNAVLQAQRARGGGQIPAAQDVAQAAHPCVEAPILLPVSKAVLGRIQNIPRGFINSLTPSAKLQ
jgi:hypothetical protein